MVTTLLIVGIVLLFHEELKLNDYVLEKLAWMSLSILATLFLPQELIQAIDVLTYLM